jgi:type III restriction enzyme
LNELESSFASELDKINNLWWCRNQSRSGYKIPLVDQSGRNFYPDFLIWNNKNVIAADTSGEHLLQGKVDSKLPFIKCPDDARQKLVIRFFTKGKYCYEDNRIRKINNNKKDDNFWSMVGKRRNGKVFVKFSSNLQELIE